MLVKLLVKMLVKMLVKITCTFHLHFFADSTVSSGITAVWEGAGEKVQVICAGENHLQNHLHPNDLQCRGKAQVILCR